METTFLLLLALGFLLVLLSGDWRLSVFSTVFIGFAQDPLRKITPGQPQYMVGLVIIAAVLTMIALYISPKKIPFKDALWQDKALLQYFPIFLWIIAIGSLNAFLRSGAIEIPLIGLFVYFSPLLALWLGFNFAAKPGFVVKLLYFYIAIVMVYAFTILLSFWGVASPLFREVGEGNLIFLDIGIGIQGHSGLWRSAEIASWHLGAASCFAIMLGVRTKKLIPILLSLAVSIFFMGTAVLTGRRKVLTLVVGFIIVFTVLVAFNARRLTRDTLFSALGLIGISAAIYVMSGGLNDLQAGTYGAFFRRGTTVFGDVESRFSSFGVNATASAIEFAGLFGFGVGMTFQEAASAIGANFTETQGTWAAEGGLGKIIYEIGVIGFLFLALMVFLLGRLYMRIVRNRDLAATPDYLLILGLISFLIANLPTFAAASQVFNDFLVLLMLGMSSGFILGLSYLAESTASQARLLMASEQPSLPYSR